MCKQYYIQKCCLFFLLSLAGNVVIAQDNPYQSVSAEVFKSTLEATPEAILLDLRTPDEIKKGIIPGARKLDYFELDFETQVSKLDKDKTYFIYCAVGGRSAETMELMSRLGFKKVYNLQEGFTSWKKKKLPVASPE